MPEMITAAGRFLLFVACSATSMAQTQDVHWEVLRPTRFSSDDDTDFRLRDDHSLIAVGVPDAQSTWTVDSELDLTGVTAIRIECPPDSSLPNGGPGRGPGGGFKVDDLAVSSLSSPSSRHEREAVIVDAFDVSDASGGPARHGVDGNARTAWGPDQGGATTTAVFLLDAPLPDEDRGLLRLRLRQSNRAGWALGALRVAITRHPDPTSVLGGRVQRSGELDRKVAEAIERGVDYLLGQQQLDGSWRYQISEYPAGSTALAAYTLMRSGLSPDHPSIERAVAYVLNTEPRRTYETAIQIMFLALHGGPRHAGAIEQRAELLLDWQVQGGWNYPGAWYDPQNKSFPPDLSITQYALLGLRAAGELGFEVPKRVWTKAASWVLDRQERAPTGEPAGFRYTDGRDVTGSMTCAGLTALGVIASQLGGPTNKIEEAIASGSAWLAREFSVSRNPRPAVGSAQHNEEKWLHYYLYGIERVAGLLDLDTIGPHRWYEKGALSLIETQKDDGSWRPPSNSESAQELADTCFALLFLNRATASTGGAANEPWTSRLEDEELGVTVFGTGSGPFRAWISDFAGPFRERFADPTSGEFKLASVVWEEVDAAGAPIAELGRPEIDPGAAGGSSRYAARFTFDLPGRHRVRPRLSVRTATGEVEVLGPILEFEQLFAGHSALIQYAGDRSRNLILDSDVEIESLECSSQLNDTWGARKAFDGLQVHGWTSADDDDEPWIRVDLGRGVRADKVLLSPLQEPWSEAPWRTGLPARVRVEINGSRRFEADCLPGRWHKTVLDLGGPARVRQLEVRVVSKAGIHPDHPTHAGVGFAEIELTIGDD